jgi:hypothetical protein
VSKMWRRSSNGPDWTDIRVMMKELMVLHQCQCYLEMFPGGAREGPSMRIVATFVSNAPGSDLKSCEEAVSSEWPNNRGLGMESEVFGLLHRADNVLSQKWWKQEVFELP